MGRMRKTAKPKTPTYERIDRTADRREVYPILDRLVEKRRPDLSEANIALAWRFGFKRNKDGQLVLGKCKKVSELDKQFQGHDFVIILNSEAWEHLSDEQREALVFHELCHAAIAEDQNGNPKKDARGRQVYRIKKHDIEEFGDVVALYGCYKQDLENFVATAMRSPKPPQRTLLDGLEEPKPEGGADGKGEAAVAEPEAPAEGHAAKVTRERRPVPKSHGKKSGGRGKSRSR
jgi:hypothetical protein